MGGAHGSPRPRSERVDGGGASLRSRLRTANPLERFTAELEKKFARVGVFPTVRSWERLTYILYRDLQARGYAPLTNNPIFTQNT